MKRWQLFGFGIAVYVLALLLTAPATLIDASLATASAGRVRLVQARGTLWSGSGQLEVRDANERSAIAQSISWRLRPAYLLLAKLRYEFALARAQRYFPVTLSPARIEIADADVDLPAAALGIAVPKLAPLELTGELQLHIARLALARTSVQGNATLLWRGAGSAFTPVSPLGDYELRLDGDGRLVKATLRTLQGPLQLEGSGSWSAGRNPEFRGEARVAPQQMQQLAPLLRMISVERGEGRFELQLQ